MNILIAPDAFKDCLDAEAVARNLSEGLADAWPAAIVRCCPLSDGGEGFVAALAASSPGYWRDVVVTGPLGKPVTARYWIANDGARACLELAQAVGIQQLSMAERDAGATTSRGVGELLLDAMAQGCRKLILGLGGSACHDGGAGLLQALGGRLLDSHGAALPTGGQYLVDLERIDLSGLARQLADVDIVLATDVTNPLLGEAGATAVFAPQKGADRAMQSRLEAGIARLAGILQLFANNPGNLAVLPGLGAAGGAGLPLVALFGARVTSGFSFLCDQLQLSSRVAWADIVVTGEGCVDDQSQMGKLVSGMADLCHQTQRPLCVVAGRIAVPYPGARCYSLESSCAAGQNSITDAPMLLRATGRQIAADIATGRTPVVCE